MGKFMLVGGGECGRPGTIYETEKIDREIVKMTGKSSPCFLLIALGNDYPKMYYDLLGTIYREKFNCETEQLTMEDLKDERIAKAKIEKADIIYVGGGKSLRLLKRFRRYGINKMLEEALKRDTVLCGLSAGAICWCKYGNSASLKNGKMIRVKALDFVNILICPHYDSQAERYLSLKEMMRKTTEVPAIALDDLVALRIIDDTCTLIGENNEANAYKTYWKDDEYFEEKLERNKQYKLSELSAI